MQAERWAKIRRLWIWFIINLAIFVACYLNYRFQLKHRYLYKTLNIGLCLSRAAAMVINFNLLLVWLPMCKYTLTRLACLATGSLKRHRREHQQKQQQLQIVSVIRSNRDIRPQFFAFKNDSYRNTHSKCQTISEKVKRSAKESVVRLSKWFCSIKIRTINNFIIAVDHCKSLHTICATTITLASVIHTAAHLSNVINFSKNYDPLLGDLNMAEYKDQNPFQLLISVPGITGCLMIIILILMSLSSMDFIRNSSYDLFQIFHRLSIVFVILLLLHPFSHFLKEQSNVDRHHPELCYSRMLLANYSNDFQAANSSELRPPLILPPHNSSLAQLSQVVRQNESTLYQGQPVTSITRENSHQFVNINQTDLNNGNSITSNIHHYIGSRSGDNSSHTRVTVRGQDVPDTKPINLKAKDNSKAKLDVNVTRQTETMELASSPDLPPMSLADINVLRENLCLDLRPTFVAQSSICWYVLSIGLSCYLFDLLLRKWRRSKSNVQLLNVRLDQEGNLIELILSSNHKRFSHWLPGQFVYLNCPQIATYEWHPFTISSMDNGKGEFTLHIKTGGDWTRKLRQQLECSQNSMSFLSAHQQQPKQLSIQGLHYQVQHSHKQHLNMVGKSNIIKPDIRRDYLILPNFDCCNETGKLQIECTKLTPIKNYTDNNQISLQIEDVNDSELMEYSTSCCPTSNLETNTRDLGICNELQGNLNLFIDGPFHSPFERLLEQEVSVCIANGVGWTAFSSVFQCITNNMAAQYDDELPSSGKEWWSKWRRYAIKPNLDNNRKSKIKKLSETKLHLMVIVTSIEQLKPLYRFALDYFEKIQNECQMKIGDELNPVREVTALITRSTKYDDAVREFCRQENLAVFYETSEIKVNDVFTIRFERPEFENFLKSFRTIYSDRERISVYCCGSYQVKKAVKEICKDLNKMAGKTSGGQVDKDRHGSTDSTFGPSRLLYSYHEENF